MLSRIVTKTASFIEAIDSDGLKHRIKILNFTASGTRTSKLDRQCTTDVKTSILEGYELVVDSRTTLIVSYKQADWYKGKIIRYVLDCIDSNQTVNILRHTLNKTQQGGLGNQQDTVVYSNIPVKIGLYEAPEAKDISINIPKYVMYLSTRYALAQGDRIVISDTSFEVAKVNSFIHVTPGLMEVRFDKDPRWL